MNPTERQPFVSWDYKEIAVESAYLSQYLDAYACFGWQARAPVPQAEPAHPQQGGADAAGASV